jgi:broad specificity phosphatase PhoE
MHQLYLIRHALTLQDRNRPPHEWELDPEGRAVLEELTALPCFRGALRIVCSTEPKARRTAEAFRSRHEPPPAEPLDGLREIHKAGWVDNHDAVMARVFAEPEREAAEGWETGAAALARFQACLEPLVAGAGGQDLIVVSHATVLSFYLARLQGQDRVNPAQWRAIGFPDLAVVDTAAMRLVQPFGAWRK